MPLIAQRPKRILTLEERQALLAATETLQMRCLFELLLATGMRIGEALGLTVADLDTKNSIVRIECQLARDGTRAQLKTEDPRRALDIPPRLTRKVCAVLLQRGALTDPDACVFASQPAPGSSARSSVPLSPGPHRPSEARGTGADAA